MIKRKKLTKRIELIIFFLAMTASSLLYGKDRDNLFPGSLYMTDVHESAFSVDHLGHITYLKNEDVFSVEKEMNIEVDYSESATLHLSNGLNVYLQDHTNLLFSPKSFLHVKNSSDYILTLEMSGAAWFKSSAKPTEGTSFFIITPTAEIEVESSEFYVEAVADSYTTVRCLEGTLRLTNTMDLKTTIVIAGNEVRITGADGEKNCTITKVRMSQRSLDKWQEKRESIDLPPLHKWSLKNQRYFIENIELPKEK